MRIILAKRRPSFSWLIGTALLFLCLQRAHSATFNIADGDKADLNNAIRISSLSGQDNTINLAPSGTYQTTGPLLRISGDSGTTLTINGNGATISQLGAGRILVVDAGGSSFYVVINSLVLTGGYNVAVNCGPETQGGAMVVQGGVGLTLNNCTISNNLACFGGGMYVDGATATLNNCTLTGNLSGDYVEGGGRGDAIFNSGSTVTLKNCTISPKQGLGRSGIYNLNSILVLSSCTLELTSIYNDGDSSTGVTLGNTILFGSGLVRVGTTTGTFTSLGYNLINLGNLGGAGYLTGPGDQTNTDPKLGPLADNGGPTLTFALLDCSPAINKGNSFGQTTDQRGYSRPFYVSSIPNAKGGDGSDIGAYEAQSGDSPQSGNPSFVVTTTDDHDDGVAGFCDCTLREAIHAANLLGGRHTITFAPQVLGTITLQAGLDDLGAYASLNIIGPGARVLAVTANPQSKAFEYVGGTNYLSGLTIRDGHIVGGPTGQEAGGGIYVGNQATLTIDDCTISGNNVYGGSTSISSAVGNNGLGGGIYNGGVLTLERCAFINNRAYGGNGAASIFPQTPTGGAGGDGQGAAVFNDTAGTLTMTDCTFYSNVASGGAGGDSYPGTGFGGNGGAGSGAVFNLGVMTATACTLSGNTGSGGAGGIGGSRFHNGYPGAGSGGLVAGGGSSTVRNTISATNLASGYSTSFDVDGAFNSAGHNLIGTADHSTGFTAPGDQAGTDAAPLDPKLGPMQNNGGPTDTLALGPSSPAVEAGDDAILNPPISVTIDQRGFPRKSAVHVDIGAYELLGYSSIPELIVDNTNATFTGSWSTDSGGFGTGFYGQDYRYATTVSSSSATATFRPNLPLTGNYDVYVWYPLLQSTMRCSDAEYVVSSTGGTNTVRVNQLNRNSSWVLIASGQRFAQGTNGFVQLSNQSTDTGSGKSIAADAVRWAWSSNQVTQPYFTSITRGASDATLTWLSGSNYVYRLQYKTNLTDAAWLDVSGDVTATTNTASKTDSALGNAATRFYRVELLH